MKKIVPLFFPLFISVSLFSQNKLAYRLFDIKGKKVSYKALKKQVLKADIILFGEFHDNPISHWLELEIIKDLNKSENLIIGAEMFESDNQQLINDYLSGALNFNTLDSMGRLWSNYKTDYSPIVEYAKKNNLPVVATNIPRKYASKVFKNGGFQALDNLSDFEKKFIAPLPIDFDIELSQYKNMLDMMGDHASSDIVKAQAVKDATMAHFILQNYSEGDKFLHINGSYHSDFRQGILWYLMNANSTLKYMTISTVYQENVQKLSKENMKRANFIICVDSDITRTF